MHIHTRVYLHTYIHGSTHSTVQYSTVQYSTVQYSTVQYSSNTLYVLNHCRIKIRIRIKIRLRIIEATYIHGSTLSIRVRYSTVQTHNDIY